ncbi:hypothetical protein I0C86_34195, partial [Plantactinospora sp. S1510]
PPPSVPWPSPFSTTPMPFSGPTPFHSFGTEDDPLYDPDPEHDPIRRAEVLRAVEDVLVAEDHLNLVAAVERLMRTIR